MQAANVASPAAPGQEADRKQRIRQTIENTILSGSSNSAPLSVEGVFQMAYILPERLLALVRPAFDLVLRRIRSLKRCVQACGCKIMTPRYACNLAPGCISSEPTFAGLRKNKKKENKGSQKKGSPKKREKGFPLAKLDIA